MTTRARPSGFALPAVIVAMLLLGVLTAAACLVATQIARMGRAAREGVHALYAAEAGLADALALWPDSIAASLAPGGTATLDPVAFANGDEVVVRIERIDDASSPALARFLVHAYGRARLTPHAGRHLVLALARRAVDTLCCPDSLSSARASQAQHALARESIRETCLSAVPPGADAIATVLSSDAARLTRLPMSAGRAHPEASRTAHSAWSPSAHTEPVTDPRYTLCIPTGVPGERPVPVPLAERPWIELYW